MNQKKIGVWLFTFLSFLLWLYLAANHSNVDDWWTVKSTSEITLKNKDLSVISPIHFRISPIKVFIGLAVFILLGTVLSSVVVKRERKV